MTLTRKFIGKVGVDTGSILIIDPCYAKAAGEQLEAIHKVTRDGRFMGTVVNPKGSTKVGVAFPTFQGDGWFPVYAETDEDGKLVRVVIEMKD